MWHLNIDKNLPKKAKKSILKNNNNMLFTKPLKIYNLLEYNTIKGIFK